MKKSTYHLPDIVVDTYIDKKTGKPKDVKVVRYTIYI